MLLKNYRIVLTSILLLSSITLAHAQTTSVPEGCVPIPNTGFAIIAGSSFEKRCIQCSGALQSNNTCANNGTCLQWNEKSCINAFGGATCQYNPSTFSSTLICPTGSTKVENLCIKI